MRPAKYSARGARDMKKPGLYGSVTGAASAKGKGERVQIEGLFGT